jgi:hypothetical protein
VHLRRCAVSIDDFDRATNARHFNTRSRLQFVRLVNFVALVSNAVTIMSSPP